MSVLEGFEIPASSNTDVIVDWLSLESSVLSSAAYLKSRRMLYLRFHSGEVYRYFDFPPERYLDFVAAESKGRYFAANIRDQFRCERVLRLRRSASGSV